LFYKGEKEREREEPEFLGFGRNGFDISNRGQR